MKLTIYLAKEDIKKFDQLIQDKYRSGATTLNPSLGLPFSCMAYIRQSRAQKPKWTAFLKSHFDLSPLNILQRSSSFALVLKAKGRVFAVTFGYGFTAIDRSQIEPRFGLKTSLALLDDAKIRTLDSRNIDKLVRQRRTHVTSGSRIWDFGVSPSAEWIRYISGKTNSNELGSSVAGSDSLAINCDIPLDELGKFCGALLSKFQSSECAKRFEFFDRMQPLKSSDPIVPELEDKLSERFAKRSDKKLVIAYPDFTEERLVDHYRVGSGHHSIEMSDISLSKIYGFLDKNPQISASVDKIWVIGEDAEGNSLVEKRTLREYLVCEVIKDDSVYYLSFGEWHQAARKFVDRIRRQVKDLPDDTGRLRMPAMLTGEREDDYNARVAQSKGWLLLDKNTFPMGGHDRVEVCDLYTRSGELIAVKKMRDSANLSHLFSQGSVSAALLTSDPDYRKRLQGLVKRKWNGKKKPFLGSLFVYAMPTKKAGVIAHEMFLFSQVNLLDHVQRIRAAGHRVSLCKIDYVPE